MTLDLGKGRRLTLEDRVVTGRHIGDLISKHGCRICARKIWNKPLEFRPERHFTSDCTDVQLADPDLRFISFSIERRHCMAPILGTVMTIMLLARMVQGFNWKAPPNVTSINLDESFEDLSLANPLVVHAEPRLPFHLYP
ncbi:hypothetical protein NL676_014072 [Syzygium grande]|nr:hypothetical protein NL676_014072 [Syzygium grande]